MNQFDPKLGFPMVDVFHNQHFSMNDIQSMAGDEPRGRERGKTGTVAWTFLFIISIRCLLFILSDIFPFSEARSACFDNVG